MERVVSAYSRHRGCIALPTTCGGIAAAPMLALLSSGAQKINPLCVPLIPHRCQSKKETMTFPPKSTLLDAENGIGTVLEGKRRMWKISRTFCIFPGDFPR